jgi:hypothetical protein
LNPADLYSDPEALPFHISQYSPAYYMAVELAFCTMMPEKSD